MIIRDQSRAHHNLFSRRFLSEAGYFLKQLSLKRLSIEPQFVNQEYDWIWGQLWSIEDLFGLVYLLGFTLRTELDYLPFVRHYSPCTEYSIFDPFLVVLELLNLFVDLDIKVTIHEVNQEPDLVAELRPRDAWLLEHSIKYNWGTLAHLPVSSLNVFWVAI